VIYLFWIFQDTLQSVTAAMSAYRSIPSRRIRQLASKLVHHKTMKMIETNVRSSNLLTSEVFNILGMKQALLRFQNLMMQKDFEIKALTMGSSIPKNSNTTTRKPLLLSSSIISI